MALAAPARVIGLPAFPVTVLTGMTGIGKKSDPVST